MDAKDSTVPERDQQSGRFVHEYPPNEFTTAIDALGGAASTQEVADEVGVIYDTTYKKLRSLEDRGAVESRRVASARLWSLAEEINGD